MIKKNNTIKQYDETCRLYNTSIRYKRVGNKSFTYFNKDQYAVNNMA